MPKNILIFSDGTGQAGGLKPNQRLSNVYKMYRASNIGSNSPIDPSEQISFYDAGLGTGEFDNSLIAHPIKSIRKLLGSILGIGISNNIIDCYEFIVKHYECGDRIYLFGFSRGAYTVRCVANVMNLCGVPTQDQDGKPLPRYGKRLRSIATEAVKKVYEHGLSKKRGDYEDEREEQAKRFRDTYGCIGEGRDGEGQGNVQPYFIGVFDTVAALGRPYKLIFGGALFLSVILSSIGLLFGFNFSDAWALSIVAFVIISTMYVVTSGYRSIKDFPNKGDKTRRHIISWKLTNYDKYLDNLVPFARHAISIDEDRKNFPRVLWGRRKDIKVTEHQKPVWLKQVCFTGNHSDIGGSYPEDESRLSDISLQWMLGQIAEVPHPVIFNEQLLRIYPKPGAMQHSEILAFKENLPNWIPEIFRFTWPIKTREIHPEQELHPSVMERFELDSVSHYGQMKPYRPEALREHKKVKHFYSSQKNK